MNNKVETEAENFLKGRGFALETMSRPFGHFDFVTRNIFIARFGFAVLTAAAVKFIANYSPLLEVGAGSGYWSYELRKSGVDVIATDPGTGKYRNGGDMANWPEPWTEIERIDGVTAVIAEPNRNLLIVWPDYGNPWPAETLQAFAGSRVLYVGEGDGGCTGDAKFHELLEAHFENEQTFSLPQFSGIHDRLEVWKRKRQKTRKPAYSLPTRRSTP